MSGHNQKVLAAGIIALSKATTWERAKLEWGLHAVYWEDVGTTCLCSHYPIKEICVLYNATTGREAIVGNVCVKKFMGLRSNEIFVSLKRIDKNIHKSLSTEAILHAYDSEWINEWERDFYFGTTMRRRLTPKQMAKRVQINELVLRKSRNEFKNRKEKQ